MRQNCYAMPPFHNWSFEVLTAVTMSSSVVWNVTPCSLAEFYRRFEVEEDAKQAK
jgi:hypothetical protein